MACSTGQINIYQGAQTKIDIQVFDENNVVKDLTGIDSVGFKVAKKSDRVTIIESPSDATGSVTDAVNGRVSITVNSTVLDGITPINVDVEDKYLHVPTPTLFGYIELSALGVMVDKIYLPEVAIYFDTLPKVP